MEHNRVGFIGLGSMGAPMAERFLNANMPLTVFDTNTSTLEEFAGKGARIATSAREVADAAEVVISCLPSTEISLAVALGEGGVTEGKAVKVYVDTGTIGKTMAELLADRLPARIGFLDAPVSGGPPAARAGTLSTIVSGPQISFDAALPALSIMAAKVFHIGARNGLAQVAKLINNHLSNSGRVAAFEGFVLGMKAGIDPHVLLDVINASTGRNYTTSHKMAQGVLSGEFKFSGTLHVSIKDQKLLLEQAAELGVPLAIAPPVLATLEQAAEAGYLDKDGMYLIQYIGEQSGINVKERLEAATDSRKT